MVIGLLQIMGKILVTGLVVGINGALNADK